MEMEHIDDLKAGQTGAAGRSPYMAIDLYQQVLMSLLRKLSMNVPSISDLPERIGICFDSDITVNIELLSHYHGGQVLLTGKVGPVADFGTFFDVCTLVAKGNFCLTKANGCALSVHEESQTVYVQYACPLASGDFRMIDAAVQLLEKALLAIIEFIKRVRSEGLH